MDPYLMPYPKVNSVGTEREHFNIFRRKYGIISLWYQEREGFYEQGKMY